MEQSEIRQLLQAVAAGERSVEDALLQLKEAPFEDLGFAKLDHHRALRQGAAEVIYGAGKTPEQILKITQAMLHHGQKTVLITRLSKEAADFLTPQLPLTYYELGRVGIAGTMPEPTGRGKSSLQPAARATSPSPRKRRLPLRRSEMRLCGSTMWVSRGFTDCCLTRTMSCRRRRLSQLPAWKGRLQASSAGLPTARSLRCRPAWATAQASAAWQRFLRCSTPAPAA